MKRTPPPPFVLLHGAWHGGWCWAPVAAILRDAGHRVFTPTQTGLGERRHLLSPAITLETFAQDLIGVIEAEELHDIVLVGHSFGGIAISAAADRIPARIRHLVYLDSVVLLDGQTALDRMAPALAAERLRLAHATSGGLSVPPPDPAAFGVPAGPLHDWVARRLTPQPLGAYTSVLPLAHPVGHFLPRTYVVCTDPPLASLQASRDWVRGQAGWGWQELATGHDAMVTAPAALAALLIGLATTEPAA